MEHRHPECNLSTLFVSRRPEYCTLSTCGLTSSHHLAHPATGAGTLRLLCPDPRLSTMPDRWLQDCWDRNLASCSRLVLPSLFLPSPSTFEQPRRCIHPHARPPPDLPTCPIQLRLEGGQTCKSPQTCTHPCADSASTWARLGAEDSHVPAQKP